MSSLGERLRILRNKRNLTQTELAEALEMSHSTVAMWEVGRRDPDSNMILKIAKYFNVTTDYLLGQSDISFNVDPLVKEDVYIAYFGGPPEELDEDEAEALKLELEKFRALKQMRALKNISAQLKQLEKAQLDNIQGPPKK